MSAAGRGGASIFAQGSARGAPVPTNEDDPRRFPTWSLGSQLLPRGRPRSLLSTAPGTHFLASACVLLAGTRRPIQGLRRRLQRHHTEERTVAPPHHVPHPGLRHREKRSRPARVSAQRPARERRPRDQSAALRPGQVTTSSGPGCRTPAGRVPSSPFRLCYPLSEVRSAPGHSWADAPRLNCPQIRQVNLEGDR